jgi:uncharacterized protein (TIGR00725 family)
MKGEGKSMQRRKVSVGVMGSAAGALLEKDTQAVDALASTLGKAIARNNCILITGETTGIPEKVLESVRSEGGLSIGISAAHNHEEHKKNYNLPTTSSDVVIYTGFGLKGRNVINIRSSEIVIVISGSIGTLNEFTIAYDEGKIIGILTGSGGVSDMIESIVKTLAKKTKSVIFYNNDPEQLLEQCLSELYRRELI